VFLPRNRREHFPNTNLERLRPPTCSVCVCVCFFFLFKRFLLLLQFSSQDSSYLPPYFYLPLPSTLNFYFLSPFTLPLRFIIVYKFSSLHNLHQLMLFSVYLPFSQLFVPSSFSHAFFHTKIKKLQTK
jgi:hypothetical protein